MRFHGLANRFKHTPETLKNEMGIPLPLGVHFLQVLLLLLPELRIVPELFFLVFVTLPPLWVLMLVFFFNFYFFLLVLLLLLLWLLLLQTLSV